MFPMISMRPYVSRPISRGKSLNEVAIEALACGAGVNQRPTGQRDLHDIAGTWRNNRAFAEALAAQDSIDEAMWR